MTLKCMYIKKIEQNPAKELTYWLITYYVYFLHFAEFGLFTFNVKKKKKKKHVTGLQLLRNFVYIIYTCVTWFDIKMIGWQELQHS